MRSSKKKEEERKKKDVPKMWLGLVFRALLICMLRNLSCIRCFTISPYLLQTFDFKAPLWQTKVWPCPCKGLQACRARCCKEELLLPEIPDSGQCFHPTAGRRVVPEQPAVPTLLMLCQVPVKPLQFLCCTLLFPESERAGNRWCWDSPEMAGVLCISLSGFSHFSAKVQFSTSHS